MKRLNKLQLTILSVFAVLLIVVGMIFYMRQITTVLSKSTVNTMQEIATHDKSFIDNYIDRTAANLTSIGIRVRNGQYQTMAGLQNRLSRELGTSYFRYIYLIDSQGKMHSAALLIQDGTQYDYVDNILHDVSRTIVRYNEAVSVDSQDETIIYALTMPHFKVDDVEFVGIVGQTLINDVRNHMTAGSFSNQGQSLVIDKDGYYIVNYFYKNGIGQQDNMFSNLANAQFEDGYSLQQLREDIKNDKAFTCSYKLDGVPYNLAVEPLNSVDWSLAVTVPSSVFLNQSRQFTVFTSLFLLSIVLILICLIAGIFRTWKMSIAAQSSAQAKSSFLNKMSHEIRTPLNAIIGLNYLMRDRLDDKEALTEYLDKTADTSQYLLSLVNDILDLSKLEQSHIILTNEAFSLPEMTDLLAAIMKEEIKRKNISFTVTKQLLHPDIMGDEMRLKQVILNLLSNAVKFTGENRRISFVVSQKKIDEDHVKNIVKVIDNGIGMSQEFQAHIFEAFTQERQEEIDPTLKTSNRGSGLGMAISYLLMKNMQGKLEVQSTLGQGSCFTATWPAQIAGRAKELPKGVPAGSRPEPSPQKMAAIATDNILVAEDNKLNADILVQILRRRNYVVNVAANGKEAVEMFNASAPHFYSVILMDVQMPLLDGFAATKKIRNSNRTDAKTVRIYACTANTATEDRQKADIAGMNGFVAKPIDIKKLLAILQNP